MTRTQNMKAGGRPSNCPNESANSKHTPTRCAAQPPIHSPGPIILPSDLTNMDLKYGFSMYRGILIQWDSDYDERVLSVIDNLPVNVVDRLCVVQEYEGSISLVWSGRIPKGYEEGNCIGVPDGDIWIIYSSVALQNNQTSSAGFPPTARAGDNPLAEFLESHPGWWSRQTLCTTIGTDERTLRLLAEHSAGRVVFSSGNGGLCATIHTNETERRNSAAELRRRANANLTRAGEIEIAKIGGVH